MSPAVTQATIFEKNSDKIKWFRELDDVKGRRLHWLHGCTGSSDSLALATSAESSFDPRRQQVADQRQALPSNSAG